MIIVYISYYIFSARSRVQKFFNRHFSSKRIDVEKFISVTGACERVLDGILQKEYKM